MKMSSVTVWGRLSRTVGLLALLAAMHPAVYAQTQAFSASLSGLVHDSSQAVVAGAKVTLASAATGVNRSFTTDAEGRYSFSLLPPSTYALTVEATGFTTHQQSSIVLTAGQSANQLVTLRVGSVQSEMTVSADGPLLATDNANVSTDVSEQQVKELPLNLRNVFGFVALNSSVNSSTQVQTLYGGGQQGNADQDISFFNFGGGFMGSTAFLLDGHWDTQGSWGAVIYVPSVEAVQEFKIQTNAFTAQYGWSTGNMVNVVTKSGTNTLHGDAFEFLRNNVLDANGFFNNRNGIERTAFRRNQFGIAGGGPVYIPRLYRQRNKTFFFAYYEGLRQGTPNSFTTTVPTAEMRGGNFAAIPQALYNPFSTVQTTTGFSRTPFTGNLIPASLFSSVATKALTFYPNPTSSALVNNYSAAASLPVLSNEYGIRLDHNFSDSIRFSGRWSSKTEGKAQLGAYYGDNNPGGPYSWNPNNRLDAFVGLTYVINPTTVLSLNTGFNHWIEANVNQSFPYDVTKLGLPSSINAASNQFPNFNIAGQGLLGPTNSVGSFPANDLTYSADLNKVVGSHSFSVGFMAVVQQYGGGRLGTTNFNFDGRMTQGQDPTIADPNTSGYGFASFLLGAGSGGSTNASVYPFVSRRLYGTYVQDDWKLSRKLTLNLGLRYDFQAAPVDRYNMMATFNYADANPISQQLGSTVRGYVSYVGSLGNPRGLYQPQKTNVAPRVGIAYQAANKLVLRAGFGIFFAPAFMGSGPNPGYGASSPWVASLDGYTPANALSNPFPAGLQAQTGNSLGKLTNLGYSASGIENYRPTPYTNQWMFGFQYALTRNDSLDVSYVGNHGVKMLGGLNSNQLSPQYLTMGNQLNAQVKNPFYGIITGSGCGLNNPTIVQSQLLLPYPEYCGVSNTQPPNGFSHYDALQVTYSHRWSSGLNVLASYTFSKFLDDVGGTQSWASSGYGSPVMNSYNIAADKSVDGSDVPHSFVLSYVYELPVGKGKKFAANMNPVVNAIVGGWQVSGVNTLKAGFPLFVAGGNNNTYGGNQRPNIVGDVHVSNPTIDKWYNTAAFAQPAPYTFGNAPRYMSYLRAPGLANFDLAVQKWWKWRETLKLQFRAEAFNAANHPNFYAPSPSFGDSGMGKITAALPARSVQAALKLYW